MDIMELVKANEEYMIEMRRYFHRHPELTRNEVNTVARISEELTKMGIEHVEVPNGGILGFIDGKTQGKTVLLRADVDALPVEEPENNLKTKRTCISETPGVMHACGHDGHMAMLLTAAKILSENKDKFSGRVILMFERGEEGGFNIVCMFKYIFEKGIHIDSAYGTHLYAGHESGKISISPGPVMSGGVMFDVTIKGYGGHGSRPDLANSPIDCFVGFYNALNGIRMKHISPFSILTYSIGSLHSGASGNIISDTLSFNGSARIFELEDGNRFIKEFKTALENIAAAYGCTAEYNLIGPSIATKNNPECAALAKKAVTQAIGEEHVKDVEPWMASDPMCFILTLWPGVYALLGIANEEKGTGASNHNRYFDIDEDTLKYGAAAEVAYAIGFLNGDVDTSAARYKGNALDLYKELKRPQKQIDFLEGKAERWY